MLEIADQTQAVSRLPLLEIFLGLTVALLVFGEPILMSCIKRIKEQMESD